MLFLEIVLTQITEMTKISEQREAAKRRQTSRQEQLFLLYILVWSV